jgi:L-histidine Nalpha-methyltransferase
MLVAHYGPYDVRNARMESWLASSVEQEVPVRALGRAFAFHAGEGMHVEHSQKYDMPHVEALASAAGIKVRRHFFDARRWFMDSLWQASPLV